MPPEIVQDHSDKVEKTCTNSNVEQTKTASQELAMSISKVSSKIHEPTSYKEGKSNSVYDWQWKNAVEEELYNLESHYIWEFKELPQNCKSIEFK